MLVLDDLHWADHASLGLLRRAARLLPGARLLIICAYRDVELEAGHPLAALLPALRHDTRCERLHLRGLSDAETIMYVSRLAQQEVGERLARAIHAGTGGNPFYIGEVFHHLVEEDRLIRRNGRLTADGGIRDWGIPEGVREVIDRRLARLSADTRRVLTLAAALVNGFTFPLLPVVTTLETEPLLDCLDQALAANLIRAWDETVPRYDFAHALIRHTLYDALNPDRRLRLHRRIGEALEQAHAGNESRHAAELAAQFHASAALPGAERGIAYCLTAAEQARAAFAHEQSVSFLRMARNLAAAVRRRRGPAGRADPRADAPPSCVV